MLVAGNGLINDDGFIFVASAFESVSQVMICSDYFSVVYCAGVDCSDDEDSGLADSLSIGAVHGPGHWEVGMRHISLILLLCTYRAISAVRILGSHRVILSLI